MNIVSKVKKMEKVCWKMMRSRKMKMRMMELDHHSVSSLKTILVAMVEMGLIAIQTSERINS